MFKIGFISLLLIIVVNIAQQPAMAQQSDISALNPIKSLTVKSKRFRPTPRVPIHSQPFRVAKIPMKIDH